MPVEEATVAGIPEEHPHVAFATPQQAHTTAAAAAAAAEPTVIHLRGYRKASGVGWGHTCSDRHLPVLQGSHRGAAVQGTKHHPIS